MSESLKNRIPEFQSLMLPILTYFKDQQSHTAAELVNAMAIQYHLTEEELRLKVPSGKMGLFKNRVAWAVSYLKNAGLIFYPQRGVYQITEVGIKVLAENRTHINIAYLKTLDDFKRWQSSYSQPSTAAKADIIVDEDKTPEEVLGVIFENLNSKLAYELLEILKSKPAAYFEYFVLELLSNMGYGGVEESNFEVVGQSGDNGIDGIIYQDKLGIDRIYVQAKRWKDAKIQSKDIRDFIGSLSLKGTNKGIFITTSEFTDDASKTVLMNPQNRIILINGQQLANYAIEHNIGVQVKRVYEEKSVDHDFFEGL